MTGNEPSSSLTYSTQAELKPNKAWLGLAHFHPTANPRFVMTSPGLRVDHPLMNPFLRGNLSNTFAAL